MSGNCLGGLFVVTFVVIFGVSVVVVVVVVPPRVGVGRISKENFEFHFETVSGVFNFAFRDQY